MIHTMATEEIKGPALTLKPEEEKFQMKLRSDFGAVRHSAYFVDKTLFMKQWIDFGIGNLHITAPPRLGKSALIDMMIKFFGATYEVVDGTLKLMSAERSEDFKLFEETRIYKEEKEFFQRYFKQYYVLHINFSPLMKVKDYESFKEVIARVIIDILEPLKYTLKDKNIDKEWGGWFRNHTENHEYCTNNFILVSSLFGIRMIDFLYASFKKPIILVVDDFDSILLAHAHVLRGSDIQMNFGTFIRAFLEKGNTFKSSNEAERAAAPKLFRSFFTGSLDLGGTMTHLTKYMLPIEFFSDEQIAKFYGFTKKEVQELLRKENMMNHFQRVEEFYDGYSVMKSDLRLFNIVSVIKYLHFKELNHYMENFGSYDKFLNQYTDAFSTPCIGVKISECLHKKECMIRIWSGDKFFQLEELKNKIKESLVGANDSVSYLDISLFLTLLTELGLLAVVKDDGNHYAIRPTNEDTTDGIEAYLNGSKFFNNALNIDNQMEKDFVKAILEFDGTEESMIDLGDAIFMLFSRNPSILEKDYISVLYSLLRKISSHHPSVLEVESAIRTNNKGEIDTLLYFINKKILIILEGKCAKSGADGVDQILRQDYLQVLTDDERKYSRYDIHHKILLGLCILRTGSINMNYLIDTLEKEGSSIYARKAGDKEGTKTKRQE